MGKKAAAQTASARTRWDESLSVADGSHSMADSRDQNLWFKLFWAQPVTCHCAETLRLWSIAWKGACGPKLPRPELDETKAAVLFDASPYRQDKNCYTFESTHSAAVNGNRVWAKKLLAQDASARTRCGESLSVADGSHSMADSRDQNLWFKLFWAEPVTA